MALIVAVLFYIFIDIMIGLIAMNKTIGFWGGFLISFFFSPLIGLIFALASTRKSALRQPVINNYYNPAAPSTFHPDQQQSPPVYQPVQNQSPTPDKIQLLEKLADMRAKGVLTEDEFQREKEKVLNS